MSGRRKGIGAAQARNDGSVDPLNLLNPNRHGRRLILSMAKAINRKQKQGVKK